MARNVARTGGREVRNGKQADALTDVGPFPAKGNFEMRRQWFDARLSGRSVEESILLAGRSALRVLPMLRLRLTEETYNKKTQKELKEFILPLLRCCAIVLDASLTATDKMKPLKSASTLAVGAMRRDFGQINSGDAFDSAKSAIESIMLFVESLNFSGIGLNPAAASNRSLAYDAAARAAAYASAFPGAVDAFEADLASLGAKGSLKARQALAVRSLWPRVQHGSGNLKAGKLRVVSHSSIPDQIQQRWLEFQNRLRSAPDDWEVWGDWYSGVLNGALDDTYIFGLPKDRALELCHRVALIKDDLWKAEPSLLNAEFKRLIDDAKNKIGKNSRKAAPTNRSETISSNKTPPEAVTFPRTQFGRAVIENGTLLVCQSLFLVRLIEMDIERIEDSPANDPETAKEQAKEIGLLQESLRAAEDMRAAFESFQKGRAPEQTVVAAFRGFGRAMLKWLEGVAPKQIEQAAQLGMIAASTAILTVIGVEAEHAMFLSGAVVAKEPVIAMLKASGDILKAK